MSDWMEQRAKRIEEAGGLEAYEAKKFLKTAKSIKPEQWKRMNSTLTILKGFIDVETTVFRSFKDSIVESIKLKTEELLAPIKNEITAQTNKILEPLLPFLNEIVNNIIVPVIQWIADRIQDVVDLIKPGFDPWGDAWNSEVIQWILAHPGKTYVDYLLSKLTTTPETLPGYDKIMDIEGGM